MEIVLAITSIIIIIFGILQIILFFKIWEMTNNIKRVTNLFQSDEIIYIRNNIESINNKLNSNKNDYKLYLLIDEKEKAYKKLQEDLANSLLNEKIKSESDDLFTRKAESIIISYWRKFRSIGYEMPKNMDSTKSFIDFYNNIVP